MHGRRLAVDGERERAGDAAHIGRRLRQRIEVFLDVKEDRLVDYAADDGGKYVVHDLLVGSFDQGHGFIVHGATPPSRKNGNTRLSGVSLSIGISDMSISMRPLSARFSLTCTERTSFARGSAAKA